MDSSRIPAATTTSRSSTPGEKRTERSGWPEIRVERIDGVRFAQLFESLPKERAATGPEAQAQVLAMANEGPGSAAATGSGTESEMSAEMKALGAPLLQAAHEGEDVQPHLAALREHLLAAAPDQAEAIDAPLANLPSPSLLPYDGRPRPSNQQLATR